MRRTLTVPVAVAVALLAFAGARDRPASPPALRQQSATAATTGAFAHPWWIEGENQIGAGINAFTAWKSATGRGITVAIIDTGIDPAAPEVAGHLWTNPRETPNGLDDDKNGIIDDVHGADIVLGRGDSSDIDPARHGTDVAAFVVQAAPDASVMALNGASRHDTQVMDGAHLVPAVRYAVEHGARVLNLSFGVRGSCPDLNRALSWAVSRGVVVFIAAGNQAREYEDGRERCPSFATPGVAGVSSIDNYGRLARDSNWGAAIHVAAPGDTVSSRVVGGRDRWVWGTSFATPLAAGVAALMLQSHPSASPAQIVQTLIATSHPLDDLRGKVQANGVIDATAALRALDHLPPAPEPKAPTAPRLLSPTRSFTLLRPRTITTFRWSPSTAERGLCCYAVYLDGRMAMGVPGSTTATTISVKKGHHSWNVVAVDVGHFRSDGR